MDLNELRSKLIKDTIGEKPAEPPKAEQVYEPGSLGSLLEQSLQNRVKQIKEEHADCADLRKKLTENIRMDIIKGVMK